MKINKFSIALSCLLSLLSLQFLHAGIIENHGVLTKNNLTPGKYLTVNDPVYSFHKDGAFNHTYQVERTGYVMLEYRRDKKTDLLENGTWEYEVDYYISNTGESGTLAISFQEGRSVYRDVRQLTVFNDRSLEVQIADIRAKHLIDGQETILTGAQPAASSLLPTDIELKFVYQVNTAYELTASDQIELSQSGGQLDWSSLVYANEYELQWVHVDEYAGGFLEPAGPVYFEYKEPVSVVTAKTNFQLDMIFPSGTVVFRVRAIGKKIDKSKRIEDLKPSYGPWCYGDANEPFAHQIILTDHEPSKNWSYQQVFTDNGQHKESMTYADGGLKTRQTMTRLSTDEKVVATSLVMDKEGRPAVSVLPAPVGGNQIKFYSQLNMDQSNQVLFGADHFDKDYPEKIGTANGAGKYYSPFNDQWDAEFRGTTPDAQGYAYSQVQYVPDGTGRVYKHSGVGPDHKIGSGHETKYYYSTPMSSELQRLFGTDIGNVKHYKKVVSFDPNGQISIAYQDQEGRTIATGLAGTLPTGMAELETPLETETIYVNLMENNIPAKDLEFSSKSEASILNLLGTPSAPQEVTLNYDVAKAPIFKEMGKCELCKYTLSIKVVDPDGMPVNLAATNVVTEEILETFPTFSIILNPGEDFDPSLNLPSYKFEMIKEGEYTILKELRSNEDSHEDLKESIRSNPNLYTDAPVESEIIDSYLLDIDLEECDLTCEQLAETQIIQEMADNGTPNYTPTQEEIAVRAHEICGTIIDDAISAASQNECEAYYDEMLEQVSPEGRWFESVKEEFQPTDVTSSIVVYDEYGEVADEITNPDWTDIETHWKEEWAATMVSEHPEYDCYQECLDKEQYGIKKYMYKMAMASDWNEANGLGYTSPSNDPLVVNFGSHAAVTTLLGKESNVESTGLSLEQFVDYESAHNKAVNGIFPENSLYKELDINAPDFEDKKNKKKWILYRGIYEGYRQEAINGVFPCDYISNGIFDDPTDVPETNEELEEQVVDHFLDQYGEENCLFNAQMWAYELQKHCPSLSTSLQYISFNEFVADAEDGYWGMQDIVTSLEAYCANQYDYQNIFGFVDLVDFEGLADQDIDPNLKVVLDRLNSSSCVTGSSGTVTGELILKQIAGGYEKENCTTFTEMKEQFNRKDFVAEDFEYFMNDIIEAYNYEFYNKIIKDKKFHWTELAHYEEYSKYFRIEYSNYPKKSLSPWCFKYIPNSDGFTIRVNYDEDRKSCREDKIEWYIDMKFQWYDENGNIVRFDNLRKIKLQPADDLIHTDDGQGNITYWCKVFGTSRDYHGLNINVKYNPTFSSVDFSDPNFESQVSGEGYGFRKMFPDLHGFCQGDPICTLDDIIQNGYIEGYFNSQNRIIYVEDCETYKLDPSIDLQFNFDLARTECQNRLKMLVTSQAKAEYERLLDEYTDEFYWKQLEKCFSQSLDEVFYGSYVLQEGHYTLYYYDQAGNLTQTVPPEGVNVLDETYFVNGRFKVDHYNATFGTGDTRTDQHTIPTEYEYNSLDALAHQESPDGGEAWFFYDELARLRFSQNNNQFVSEDLNVVPAISKQENAYSYTNYDALGRIVESGVSDESVYARSFVNKVNDYDFPAQENTWEVSRTHYDQALNASLPQENLQSRVTATSYHERGDEEAIHLSHYDYDELGNVKTLYQEYPGWSKYGIPTVQKITYDYDLLTGKVLEVSYNAGRKDQFYHRYKYDADHRLTEVLTSDNGLVWDSDARYFYHLHGPLARTELGQDNVQGQDYVNTLHGWMKTVNSHTGRSDMDLGEDGQISSAGNAHALFAKDAYGYGLDYYNGDYKSISEQSDKIFTGKALALNESYVRNELFNGNIAAMYTSIYQHDGTSWSDQAVPQIMEYKYDRLNRLKEGNSTNWGYSAAANRWQASLDPVKYDARFTYDANGNIKTLKRKGPSGWFDDLTYTYDNEKINQLKNVQDIISTPDLDFDIEGQGDYSYDNVGNLTRDNREHIDQIQWSTAGKILGIRKNKLYRTEDQENGQIAKTRSDLEFKYDAMGNRICKIAQPHDISSPILIPNSGGILQGASPLLKDQVTTWYVRDAGGNIMATYQLKNEEEFAEQFTVEEMPMYGSNRLGVFKPEVRLTTGAKAVQRFNEQDHVDSWNLASPEMGTIDTYTQITPSTTVTYLKARLNENGEVQYTTPLLEADKEYELIFHWDLGTTFGSTRFKNITCEYPAEVTGAGTTTNTVAVGGIDAPSGTVIIDRTTKVYISMSGTSGAQTIRFYGTPNPLNNFQQPGFELKVTSVEIRENLASDRNSSQCVAGAKQFELSNHLGNVLSVVSDRKLAEKQVIGEQTFATSFEGIDNSVFDHNLDHSQLSQTVVRTGDYSLFMSAGDFGPYQLIQVAPGDQVTTAEVYAYRSSSAEIKGVSFVRKLQGVNEEPLYTHYSSSTGQWEGSWTSVTVTDVDSWKKLDYDPFTVPAELYHADGTVADPNHYYIKYELWGSPASSPSYVDDYKVVVNKLQEQVVYTPDIVSASDYYPFGMQMPGRNFAGGNYSFGFNGMEKDDAVKGEGNSYDFGARMYDPRIGRWMSVDPLANKIPDMSPYVGFANNPIYNVDPDGEVFVAYNKKQRRALRRYIAELEKTAAGREVLENIRKSEQKVVINFTDALLLNQIDGNTYKFVEGLTHPGYVDTRSGAIQRAETRASSEKVTIVTISLANHQFRKFLKKSTGRELKEFDKTSSVDAGILNDVMSEFVSTGVSAENQWGDEVPPEDIPKFGVKSRQFGKKYNFNKTVGRGSQALDNESEDEFVGRVGVHEGEHVRTFDKLHKSKIPYLNKDGSLRKGWKSKYQDSSKREYESYKQQKKQVGQQLALRKDKSNPNPKE